MPRQSRSTCWRRRRRLRACRSRAANNNAFSRRSMPVGDTWPGSGSCARRIWAMRRSRRSSSIPCRPASGCRPDRGHWSGATSPSKDQVVDTDATVYTRLREAGAVLVAKLSSGALALSAQWFGGLTRNPWNTEQDASGSSAGPGSATAAGLVPFSIGTDTGGSIISPSARNGVTGLRPTFGRVSRYGAMVLAWTQDTVGPICRSAEDCALVFHAIHGLDGKDNSVIDVPFNWDATADVTQLRVGYLRSAFEGSIANTPGDPDLAEVEFATRTNNQEALRVIRSMGVQVVPFDLPDVPIP